MCPIPGDNGNPKKEKEAGEERIADVAENVGPVTRDLKFNKPSPTPMGGIK